MSIQPNEATRDALRIAELEAEVAMLRLIVRRAARQARLGWAVDKAKARGEVEVLIANLEADAHAHHEETT